MSKSLSQALLLVAVSLAALWSVTIPLWHFPDEQAHFAQVQNYAELARDPSGSKDLSAEIYLSEEKLGTLRDQRGNNNFTYNRGYNIAYSETTQGFHEQLIKSQPRRTRVTYMRQESPRYPPLFYGLSAVAYRLGYSQDLFIRVFFTRLLSVALFGGIVWASFKLGQVLFPQHPELSVSASLLVLFHPMLMFVSSGINNDTLMTFLTTVLIWQLLKLQTHKLNLKSLALIGLLVIAGILTKQTFYLLLPTILICLLASFVHTRTKLVPFLALLGFSSLIILVIFKLLQQTNQGFWMPYWPALSLQEVASHPQLIEQVTALLGRLYRETFVWYWGVYRWLSLTLPLNIYRLIKIMIIVSGFGWLVYCRHKFQLFRAKKTWFTTLDKNLLLLIFANLSYCIILFSWELSTILLNNFGHGIQGRYFFPLIASQMILLVFGWWQLTPRSLRRDLPLVLFVFGLGLNLYSLYYVLSSYYNFGQLTLLSQQISQYKPWFAKWPYLIFPLLLAVASCFWLFAKLIQLELKLGKKENDKVHS